MKHVDEPTRHNLPICKECTKITDKIIAVTYLSFVKIINDVIVQCLLEFSVCLTCRVFMALQHWRQGSIRPVQKLAM
jgi:hypothetical protein